MRLLTTLHEPVRAGRWYYEDVVTLRGGMRLRLASRSWTEWQALFLGSQDFALSRFFAERDWSGAVALDIGANYGFYSALFARACRHVHAFEPLPSLLERLRYNVTLNGFDNVSVHPFALTESDGAATFHAPDPAEANQGTGSLTHASTGELIQVQTRALDSLAESIDLAGLRLVKIDVEGAEDRVIAGSLETLARHRPIVVFENDVGAAQGPAAAAATLRAAELLRGLGYRIHTLAGRPLSEIPSLHVASDLVALPPT
jgi:FkbM family methyltransferase